MAGAEAGGCVLLATAGPSRSWGESSSLLPRRNAPCDILGSDSRPPGLRGNKFVVVCYRGQGTPASAGFSFLFETVDGIVCVCVCVWTRKCVSRACMPLPTTSFCCHLTP